VNGVLIADKPAGWTSHDVVAKVKGKLRAAKVGHLGTLDPSATGVLPLVINKATRFARWIEGGVKEYEGLMTLGVETDTYDAEGTVTGEADVSSITNDDIKKAFSAFTGRIKQVPPMYSAVKRSGRPLYALARQGIVVDRPARDVEIFALNITDIQIPHLAFTVSCSRGTYVRSICHDVGRALGCGAHLGGLRRISSGPFHINEAIDPTLEREALEGAIIPLDDVLKRVCSAFRAVPAEGIHGLGFEIGMRFELTADKGFFPFQEEGEMIRFTLGGADTALAQHIRGNIYKIKWVFERSCDEAPQKACLAQ